MNILHLIAWALALVIAARAMEVAYYAYFPNSGRSAVGFGVFGYSYVALAFGALTCAAELTGLAGGLTGVGIYFFMGGSAGLILSNRRKRGSHQ